MPPDQIIRIWKAYITGDAFDAIARREGITRSHVHMAIDIFKRGGRPK